jgi:mannosyltransferase OCH1-like enzyme
VSKSLIPKIIWQTYRTDDLPRKALKAQKSWKKQNPKWEYQFCDDSEIGAFMDREYGGELAQLFHSLPLGVMKADLWRYAVLYKYGGVYTDIDTTCLVPLASWQMRWETLRVALENRMHFCQWTIAAAPGHPVLRAVLQLILERKRRGMNSSYPHFVHQYTGPGVWTDGIRTALGVSSSLSAAEIYQAHRHRAEKKGVLLLPPLSFEGWFVHHAFASTEYSTRQYVSWRTERKKLAPRIRR